MATYTSTYHQSLAAARTEAVEVLRAAMRATTTDDTGPAPASPPPPSSALRATSRMRTPPTRSPLPHGAPPRRPVWTSPPSTGPNPCSRTARKPPRPPPQPSLRPRRPSPGCSRRSAPPPRRRPPRRRSRHACPAQRRLVASCSPRPRGVRSTDPRTPRQERKHAAHPAARPRRRSGPRRRDTRCGRRHRPAHPAPRPRRAVDEAPRPDRAAPLPLLHPLLRRRRPAHHRARPVLPRRRPGRRARQARHPRRRRRPGLDRPQRLLPPRRPGRPRRRPRLRCRRQSPHHGHRLGRRGGGGSGGVIRGWRGGIAITDAHRVHLSNLTIENCAAVGVAALRCENIVHRDIAARSCAAGAAHLTAPTEPTASPFHIEVDGASGGYLSSFGILIEHPEGPGEVSITRSSISGAAGHGIHVRAVPTGSGPRGGSLILHSQTSSTRNALHGFFIELAAGSEPALRCTGLTATGNTGDGIHIGVAGGDGAQHAGSAAVIDSCDFSSNGGCGISSANPIYTQSTTCGSNALHGARVSITDQYELALDAHGCVFKKNAASGLHGPRGRYANADCRFSDNGIAGVSVDAGCLLLTRCDLTHNGETGADVRNASLTVDSSVFRRNGGFGARIQAGTAIATGMVCELNGGGGGGGSGGALFLDCPAVTLTRCIFNDNLGDGVVCSATTGPVRWMAPECVASRNAGSGFDLGGCDGGEVTRCSAIGNGAFGMVFRPTFARGRIEGNTATANAGGIAVEGQLNLVASNTVTTGPLGGLLITQGNHAAPTIGPAGLATDTNPRSNILLP